MTVLIIEDEAPAFRRLQKVLEETIPDVSIVEVLDSVSESVKWIRNHKLPDLIFMDIQLSDGISFEIFDQVTIDRPVIFTTAFDEYMLRAFKVNSIDYLLKPIKKEDMTQAIKKYEALKPQFGSVVPDIGDLVRRIDLHEKTYKSRFLIRQNDQLIAVEASQIAFFFTRHGVVHLVTHQKKTYLMDQNLEEIASQLDPSQFFRANRQYLISFRSIQAVHKYHKGKLLVETMPSAEEGVVISAEKASDFKQWLDQ